MSNNVFSIESVDWCSDCIWDAWLSGIFSSRDNADDFLAKFQSTNSIERFRVFEIEMDTNKIVEGWMVLVGEGIISWNDLDIEDKVFFGEHK